MGQEFSLVFASARVNFSLQNSNGVQMMDQLPESLQTSRAQFERLQQLSPMYGYFPESSKSILVVASNNVEQGNVEFAGLNSQVETGSRFSASFRRSHGKRQLDRKQSR